MCVAFAHLAAIPGYLHTGVYAVFGFYVLSGYLITNVLHGAYRDRPGAFLLNRLLKIFPAYYAVVIATIPIIIFLPVGSFHQAWAVIPSPYDVIANILVFPLAWSTMEDFRVVPPAWSIGVELVGYTLIFAFIGRRWWIAVLAFFFSATIHFQSLSGDMEN